MALTARTNLFGSAALLLFTAVACSTSTSGGGGGGACDQYFDALVSQSDQCGGTRDLTNARARFLQLCGNAIAAPGAANFTSQLSACAQTLASSCDYSACSDVTGTLDDGAPCAEGFQCKGGSCKKASDSSTCGTCATAAAVGQPCDESASQACAKGSICVGTGNAGTGKCVAETISKAGEPCESDSPDKFYRCDTGLRCKNASSGTTVSATCQPLGKTGDSCESRIDCETGLVCSAGKCAAALAEGASCTLDECGKGLGCNPDTKKCAAQVLAKIGEDCDEIYRVCETGVCSGLGSTSTGSGNGAPPTTTITPGKCVTPIPDGGECTKDGPPCDTFANCVNGKCVLEDPSTCK
jgi:hypothetical protein